MLKTYKILPLLGVFLVLVHLARAQSPLNGARFTAHLLRDSLSTTPGKYSFNALSITNLTSEEIQLKTAIELPEGWSLLREINPSVTLSPGENTSIPFRIKTQSDLRGGKAYYGRFTIHDPLTAQEVQKVFTVNVEAITRWSAVLLSPKVYTSDSEELPEFDVKIENNGNRTQLFEMEIQSQLRLTLPSKGNQLLLKPGTDTTLHIGVRSRTLEQMKDNIMLTIKSSNATKVLYQEIHIISSHYKVNEHSSFIMPFDIRYSNINTSEFSKMTHIVDLNGQVDLGDRKSFQIASRLNVRSGDLNLLGSYFLMRYKAAKTSIALGSVQDFMEVQINGYGGRFSYTDRKKYVEVFSLKNLYNRGSVTGLKQQVNFKEKGLLSTEALYSNNKDTKVNSAFAVHSYTKQLSPTSKIIVHGGYSHEKSNLAEQTGLGFMAGYNFYMKLKGLDVRSNVRHYSKWFPGMNRGLKYHDHGLLYGKGSFKAGGFGTVHNRAPQLYDNNFTDTYQRETGRSNTYGLQTSLALRKGNLLLKAGQFFKYQSAFSNSQSDQLSNPEITGLEAVLSYQFNNTLQSQFFSIGVKNAELSSESGSQPKVTSVNASLNGRIRNFGYYLRFDHGPNYYFDYLYFQRNQRITTRHQYSAYWNTTPNKPIRNRLSLSYFEIKPVSSRSMMLRNEVEFDIAQKDLSISLSGNLNILRPQTPFFSFSIRKSFNTNLPFFKKYRNLKVRMFKDANNNNVWDKNEEAVEHATLKINGHYVKSDASGKASLLNAPKGNYQVDFTHMDNQKGWMPKSILSDTIALQKDREILVPFKTSKVISGSLSYESAEYSRRTKMNLAGLKITASNQFGEIFETITNKDGLFFFNLVEGVYVINMPTSVLSQSFFFDKVSQSVDLTTSEEQELHFVIKEKKRKINIRRSTD